MFVNAGCNAVVTLMIPQILQIMGVVLLQHLVLHLLAAAGCTPIRTIVSMSFRQSLT